MSNSSPSTSLEADLNRARELSTTALADAIESIGFACTRCGACCTAHTVDGESEPHTATVFPDEVRTLQEDQESWRDIARPMPFGLGGEAAAGATGETFEWALQTDACGDCVFYEDSGDVSHCGRHNDRPLICATYPFSIALDGTTQPHGDPVDSAGVVRAHECEGLGRDIDREDAEELAKKLKQRAVRELKEAIAVRDQYAPSDAADVVVHDSEGTKDMTGKEI